MSDETTDVSDPVAEAPVQEAPEPQVQEQGSIPEQAPQQAPDYWGQFKGLPEFEGKSDRDIAAHLYHSMEREKSASQALAQYQQVLPYAQEFLANRSDYEKWKASAQQEAQQKSQAAEVVKKAWQPPEVKDSFRRYLTRDASGREVIADDAPLDARTQLTEHLNYRADFAQKFLDNPEDTLGPMIQELAQSKAEELISQKLEQRDNESFVQRVEQENADWLIDSNTGNVTPEGLLVHKNIEKARSLGINGPQARWDYAVAMAERELLTQRFSQQQASVAQSQQMQAVQPAPEPAPQQPPPQADNSRQNMEYLRAEASRKPSRSAGQAINNGEKPARSGGSFEQMLRETLASKGLS